jgi:hypothetical protein
VSISPDDSGRYFRAEISATLAVLSSSIIVTEHGGDPSSSSIELHSKTGVDEMSIGASLFQEGVVLLGSVKSK